MEDKSNNVKKVRKETIWRDKQNSLPERTCSSGLTFQSKKKEK